MKFDTILITQRDCKLKKTGLSSVLEEIPGPFSIPQKFSNFAEILATWISLQKRVATASTKPFPQDPATT